MVEYLKASKPDPELVRCICTWRAAPTEAIGPPMDEDENDLIADRVTRITRQGTSYQRQVTHTINPECWYHRELLITRVNAEGNVQAHDSRLDMMPPPMVKFRFSDGMVVSVTREEVATGLIDLAAASRDGRIENAGKNDDSDEAPE